MKPHAIWNNFVPLDSDDNALTNPKDLKNATAAQCKCCDWRQLPNPTRMKKHFTQCHDAENECATEVNMAEAPEVHPPLCPSVSLSCVVFLQVESAAPPAKKQATLAGYLDHKFNQNEQYNAEMALAVGEPIGNGGGECSSN